jgi:MFS family permease
MWPTLSDVIGRKIVMTLTLFGSGMGLLLQSWAVSNHWTLEQFLATRVLTGCFAGNSPISKAYLADRGSEGNKRDLTKYLAWKDASSTMAFIVGPVLGGLLYRGGKNGLDNTGGLSFVIRFSAVCSLVASLSVAMFMNSKDPNNSSATRQSTGENKHLDAEKSAELIACPLGTRLWTGVATVAAVSALYHAADSTFFAFFPSLLQQRLRLDTGSIGMAFTSFAFVSFAMSAFVSSRFIQRYGPVASCATGLGTISAALFTLSYVASHSIGVGIGAAAVIILAAAGFYYTGVPLYGPTVPTMLLQCVPPHRRGAVMGFDGTINTIARVVSPLIMGDIHRRRGAGSCFAIAGCYALTAASLAVLRRWTVLRKDFAASREETS